MAVLNVTPDSFYDGGQHNNRSRARERIDELVESGADIIDIGAESTRPGAAAISPEVQIERARDAIEYACGRGVFVSIDTTSVEVAKYALHAGAHIINDVSCLNDSRLASVAAHHSAELFIMHSRGSMTQMKEFSTYDEDAYDDVISDVQREWDTARTRALQAGVAPEKIWMDPGLGFHKNAHHSQVLLQRLAELHCVCPRLVVGPSRKSFIGALDGSAAEKRLGGTIASCLRALEAGASVLRVHDVHDVKQAILAWHAYAPADHQGRKTTNQALTSMSEAS